MQERLSIPPRERDTQKNEIIVDNDTPQCFPLFGNGGVKD